MDIAIREAAEDDGVNHGIINGILCCSYLFPILSTIMVSYKVHVRRVRGRFAAEDWLIIASLPLLYLTAGTAIFTVYRGGLGRSWSTNYEDDPNIAVTASKALVAVELFYLHTLTAVKLSLLFMYRSIFPTRWVHVSTCCMGFLCIVWWLAMFILTFTQCDPLALMWDLSGYIEGRCLDRYTVLYANSMPNIGIDCIILSLPLREVFRLQMTKPKKIGVFAVFILGIIAIIVSCLRLNSGIQAFAATRNNYTIAIGNIWMWTVVEPAIGIICACLPTVGGPMIGKLVLILTRPRPPRLKRGESESNRRKSVYTIGGSSGKGINLATLSKSKRESGSFERLEDETQSQSRHTNLWPKGYRGERHTMVSGRRRSSDRSDDIPLTSITIRKEVTWTETKIGELEMHTSCSGALDTYEYNNGVLDMPKRVVLGDLE